MNPEPQLEIHLPDEERAMPLEFAHRYRCLCGWSLLKLERKANQFRVVCGNESVYVREHTDPTPWLKSSALAIRHWKLVAVLSRAP